MPHRLTRAVGSAAILVAILLVTTGSLRAQSADAGLAARGPRFLAVSPGSAAPVPIEPSRAPMLLRRISVDLRGRTLGEALATISRESGLKLMYSTTVVPLDRPVRLKAEDITVAAALTEVLLDSKVDVMFSAQDMAVLVRRSEVAAPATGTIVGRVTNVKTGEELIGAEVALEGTRWRTATGEDGRYRLTDVPAGEYTLAVRRIGYGRQTRQVTVADAREITVDVALEPVPTQLDEVVTTVTGEQRLRELGHVVGRINADSLVKEAPVASVTDLLAARVPGLLVQPQQGTVGGEVKLQIRSATSVALNTEPIVIVDGVRYTSNPRSGPIPNLLDFRPFGSEATSRLNDLNANDIESIEVVKGPSAATLYGTDAANGVIVITTKRGQAGPPRWNAYGRASSSQIPTYEHPDVYWGWGSASSNCTLRLVALGLCAQDSVTVLRNPLNDPELTIFGSKPRWEYGANVAGGREELRYYFSADFEDATGPIQLPTGLVEEIKAQRGVDELPEELREPNAFTKLNLRTTMDAGLGRAAELRVTAGYTQSSTRQLTLNSPFAGAAVGTPDEPFSPGTAPEDAFAQTATERINRFFGSATGEWRPWTWLQARGTVGLDLTSSTNYSLARPGESRGYADGWVGDDRRRYLTNTADVGVTASFTAGRLSSRTSIGSQYVRTLLDASASVGAVLPPGGSSVGEAAFQFASQHFYERVTLGSYLEQVFGLNDRLFLTGALRMDGASGFGQDYDVAVYPKAGISWLVSDEPFLPRVPGVDELRLRYAYGASGQQPWPEWNRRSLSVYQTIADGQVGNAVLTTSIGNPDLRPERVREHEIGLDATALGGRMQLDLTWNSRTTVDQLTSVPLAPGFGSIMTNIGRIDGDGFEARLTLRALDTPALTWDIAAQHAWHTSTVVDLGGGVPNRSAYGDGYAEGFPVGGYFARPIVGYDDANGDGILDVPEVQLGDSMAYIGRGTPPRTQTLSTTVGLFQQRVRLSALLDRQSGFVRMSSQQSKQCAASSCRAAVDPSTPLADQAAVIAGLRGVPSGFTRPGDFTRLREVALALDLPDGLARAVRLRRASLSISARNLALWTDQDGSDPEAYPSAYAVDAIPQARVWAFRLDLGL